MRKLSSFWYFLALVRGIVSQNNCSFLMETTVKIIRITLKTIFSVQIDYDIKPDFFFFVGYSTITAIAS